MTTFQRVDRTICFIAVIKSFLLVLILSIPVLVSGEKIDTISFFSEVFNAPRTIYVHQPPSFKYKSEAVHYPVVYVLDGQHDWFVNPVLSDLNYLQYTHEIPQALIVVIPHADRVKECALTNLQDTLPLDRFITEEVDHLLAEKYQAGEYRMIIGHSFSASFALYSAWHRPLYYSTIIAHSPLDHLEELVVALNNEPEFDLNRISISVGSIAPGKDEYHRQNYDDLKKRYSQFFSAITTFEANDAAHNSVPIVATPGLLLKAFDGFRNRYASVAPVDEAYTLTAVPRSVEEEMSAIQAASKLKQYYYPPEIADLNGIASRYYFSDYHEHVKAIYEMGVTLYPRYYEFYLSLYEAVAESDTLRAVSYLNKSETLLKSVEPNSKENKDLLLEIQSEKKKYE